MSELRDPGAGAGGIEALVPEHTMAARDAAEAADDFRLPPQIRSIYRAAARAHRSTVRALRADLARIRVGIDPYEI